MNQHFRDIKRTNRRLTYFHNAIKKYGIDNFNFEIIDTAKTIDELNDKEVFWISKLNSTDKDVGYNLDSGGSNCFKSESTKKIIGEKTRERWKDADIDSKMSEGLRKGNETQKAKPKSLVKFICGICGKEMYVQPNVAKNKKYCSSKCSGIAFSNDKEWREKIAKSLKDNDIEYKKHVVDISTKWCLENKQSIIDCKFNKISGVLTPLLNKLNIKDFRTLSRCFDVKSRKELLLIFKNIVNNHENVR